MRYPASEKLGIIRLVEQSHLPVRRALEKLSMPRPTLYHWCGRYRTGWPEVLKDRRPQPGRVWSRTLTMALDSSGLDGMNVAHRPRLLSDNGSSQSAGDLADWLEETGMDHGRGAPLHPQTQGKIERWHQTLKNRILLENHHLPGDLEQMIGDFVAYYNHLRHQERIANRTPANAYFGRGLTILLDRERIKRDTIRTRRLQYRGKAV